jgi:hypothetical protein
MAPSFKPRIVGNELKKIAKITLYISAPFISPHKGQLQIAHIIYNGNKGAIRLPPIFLNEAEIWFKIFLGVEKMTHQ